MTIKLTARSNRKALLAGVLAMSVAGFAGHAAAESTGEQAAPTSEAPSAMQKLQAKRQEIQQLLVRCNSLLSGNELHNGSIFGILVAQAMTALLDRHIFSSAWLLQ